MHLTAEEVHGLGLPQSLELVDKLASLGHIPLPRMLPLLMGKQVIHDDPEPFVPQVQLQVLVRR